VKVITRTNNSCTNYQQMTQKLHHSQHPVFMNTPAQTAMYVQTAFKK